MTDYLNCTNQQPPTYSGVTINITNPAMNIPPQYPSLPPEILYSNYNQLQNPYCNMQIAAPNSPQYINRGDYLEPLSEVSSNYNTSSKNTSETKSEEKMMNHSDGMDSYPQQYYINNFAQQNPEQTLNIKVEQDGKPNKNTDSTTEGTEANVYQNTKPQAGNDMQNDTAENIGAAERIYSIPADYSNTNQSLDTDDSSDMETSKEIIQELDKRSEEEKQLEKSGKKTTIVSLTNEYIMSLENYLNNPNTDIRLMAAKEILTRLDEDRNRYDDAALNALLNKMLQDPNKLVRIAALSAFSSELASGNDFTVQLLTQIQQNPESDPEDVLEASQILLKRTAITEVRYVPVPNQQNDGETK